MIDTCRTGYCDFDMPRCTPSSGARECGRMLMSNLELRGDYVHYVNGERMRSFLLCCISAQHRADGGLEASDITGGAGSASRVCMCPIEDPNRRVVVHQHAPKVFVSSPSGVHRWTELQSARDLWSGYSFPERFLSCFYTRYCTEEKGPNVNWGVPLLVGNFSLMSQIVILRAFVC